MTEFNYRILCTYIGLGYKYILYYKMEHFAFIVPCYEEPETNENSYTLSITDEQVLAMAEDDEFPFYTFT